MKRAAGLELLASFLQGHTGMNDLRDIHAGHQIVDKILRDPAHKAGLTDTSPAVAIPSIAVMTAVLQAFQKAMLERGDGIRWW